MLFRRRKPEGLLAKVRLYLWPRRSWRRSFTYIRKRVLRLRATPHAIAAGFAAGVFAAFSPFIGGHILIALVLAYCISGNMAAAIIGTTVANPLTLPVIWAGTYELGHILLPSRSAGQIGVGGIGKALASMDIAAIWRPYLAPMLLGSLLLGALAAVLVYSCLYPAVRGYQHRRLHP
ncbi:DUF2062 domain-containing protein [Aureimonas fodinaquatilis]|uniref:DUF2062 domain-containing protein n=1 Tax=Aureimonas fodinaquatilis TaxID=2565783 RepID=A0A5B0DYE3_9HYPH|nr:DUF2062 domain-containing protein [Aureimonas fodinaquatilis]KAA0971032.1 DUF2062 domain-containing protein [Aureimonas fodinaquatilis]